MQQMHFWKENQLTSISTICEKLNCAPVIAFYDVKPSMIPESAGVYLIFRRAPMEVLYVGKTTNLRQRLYNNHLMGPASNARLKKYLIDDQVFPEITTLISAKEYIRMNCEFTFLLEPDMRKRGHLEGLISFLTDCRYVDKEH